MTQGSFHDAICRNLIILWLCVITSSAFAQVRAKQGIPEVDAFKSPMILDAPFPAALPEHRGEGDVRTDDDLKKYVCEGVYVKQLSASVAKPRGDEADTRVTVILHDRVIMDKRVDIQIQAMIDDKPISQVSEINNIKLGAGKDANRVISLKVKTSEVTDGTKPILRVRVAVRDDP